MAERMSKVPARSDSIAVHAMPKRDAASDVVADVPAALGFDFGSIAIQAKPEVSEPGDAAEQEADKLADAIINESEEVTFSDPRDDGAPPPVPGGNEGDETIQRKAVDGTPPVLPKDSPALRGEAGAALPTRARAAMESALGASFANVRIHADGNAAALARSLRARAFTVGRDIFFGAGELDPERAEGKRLLAHELVHVLQQRGGSFGTLQRKGDEKPKPVKVTFYVTVNAPVSGAEFFTLAVMQYTGVDRAEAEQKIKDGKFTCSHAACAAGVTQDQVGKPIGVTVQTGGMTKGEKAAAAKRTAEVNALPTAERNAINKEADERFWKRTKYKVGQPLGHGPQEEGMRQVWLRTREGVLRDKESIEKLPPKAQEFLAPTGAKFKPADYAAVVRIAKKLDDFTDEDWALYKRRVTASTDDWERLERSIDSFRTQQAAEKATLDRLRGQESLYQQVKSFKQLDKDMFTPSTKSGTLPYARPGNKEKFEAAEASLNSALAAAKFSSVDQFDDAVRAYLDLFRKRAVELTLLALRESERVVATEKQRYQDAAENQKLFDALAPSRKAQQVHEEAFHRALPSVMQLKTESMRTTEGQLAAAVESKVKGEEAETERQKLAGAYPILKDPKLRTSELNAADAAALGEVLRSDADARLGDILKTRVNVVDDNDRIFQLDRIVALTRQELGVTPNSIYDAIITDYKSQLAAKDFGIAIALAALAIGLGVLTFGGGTIAVLAAGGALALSVYQAGEEIEKYSSAKAAAHTSFDKALSVSSEDPSAVWVALALIAVGLDGSALASAMKAAGPAAKVLKETGDVAKFNAELAKATELSEDLQKALDKAGRAQAKYEAAAEELGQAAGQLGGRLYSGIPIDLDLLKKMTKTAYYAARKGVTDFEVFIREFKLGKLGKTIEWDKLTPEQLAAMEKAFNEGLQQFTEEFKLTVPFSKGKKLLTFDESGKALLDGQAVSAAEAKEVYKALDLTHAAKGHGPATTVREGALAAKSESSGLSGFFSTDKAFLESVEKAKVKVKAGQFVAAGPKRKAVYLAATPDIGHSFARPGVVPTGVTGAPVEGLEDVVEVPVKRILAIFEDDGSLVTIYPIGE